MKNAYDVPSDRYSYVHHFVRLVEGNEYAFIPADEWMPIYLTYGKDYSNVFIDTDGGPFIGVGFKTDEVEVTEIKRTDTGGVIFVLKEIEKDEE